MAPERDSAWCSWKRPHHPLPAHLRGLPRVGCRGWVAAGGLPRVGCRGGGVGGVREAVKQQLGGLGLS